MSFRPGLVVWTGLTLIPGAAGAGDLAFVVNQGAQTLQIIDPEDGAHAGRLDIPGRPAGVAVAPDGRRVYVTSPEGRFVSVIDPSERRVVARIETGGGPLGVAASADSRRVFVADWYGASVGVFDADSGRKIGELATGASPSGVDVTPDGKKILTADREDDQVSIFDAASLARLAVVKIGSKPFGVTVSPDGRRAVAANVASNDISVIDIAQARETARPKVGQRPYAAAFAAGRVFVTNQYSGTVSVLDESTWEPLAAISVGDHPEGIAASADGSMIYVAVWFDNELVGIDARSLAVTSRLKTDDGPRAFGRFVAGRINGETRETVK